MHANKQENHARRRSGLVLALVGLLSVTGLVKGPTTPASAQADAPSWSYTGNLNDGRLGHTATLLSDGTVLVPENGRGLMTLLCLPLRCLLLTRVKRKSTIAVGISLVTYAAAEIRPVAN